MKKYLLSLLAFALFALMLYADWAKVLMALLAFIVLCLASLALMVGYKALTGPKN